MSKRIYTRAGDKGKTGLLSGEQIDKADPRVESYGTVDELGTFLGVAKVHSSTRIAEYIHNIQLKLFLINAELATNPDSLESGDPLRNLERVTSTDVDFLEKIADELSEELPLLTNFVIPGGTKASAFLHVCRTVCRRAERRIVHLANSYPVNEDLIKYINRLSDLLFVMSRYENIEGGDGDQIISRKGTQEMTKK
ncbi:MAG: cob(I)yrinic acid a,c-diamide adenosyltransferase [Candidatus Thorarchaeota archaeon]|nr:cob(I)yrinic acid a,c-diamide adenosyltransferase [Candidatus Thorarchaeota archaeon]TFH05148.1 MAG: cob(I)yrinic acid a,c-diamide adenosyltransferase [Candidatus Thorarchaeota archaeon]